MIRATCITLLKIEGLPQPQPGVRCDGSSAWQEANACLRRWSTFAHRLNKVDFTVSYADGTCYYGRLELPWFEHPSRMCAPFPDLGAHMREHLENHCQWPYWTSQQCEAARQESLHFLATYEIGGPGDAEQMKRVVLHIGQLDFSSYPLVVLHGGRQAGDS